MIKTVKQACRFNPVIRDYRMSQGIENLADLINDAGDGKAETMSPSEKDWRDCSNVLSRRDFTELMMSGWNENK